MPIQAYFCEKDGEFDIHQSFTDEVKQIIKCELCGKDSKHVLYPPAGIKVIRTWNEGANEIRRTPYDQAKAQLTNNYHEKKDMGLSLPKPTEAQIQKAAKAIDTPHTPIPEWKR